MTRRNDLVALRDAVRAGQWPGLNPFHETNILGAGRAHKCKDAFYGSLDAAKALHEAVLPGWAPSLGQNVHHKHWFATVMRAENGTIVNDESSGHATCPARAWLLAILEALIAQEQEPAPMTPVKDRGMHE